MNEDTFVDIKAVVGIDVSKHKLDLVLVQGGKRKSKVFANTAPGRAELGRWLERYGCLRDSTHLCLEATHLKLRRKQSKLLVDTVAWAAASMRPLAWFDLDGIRDGQRRDFC